MKEQKIEFIIGLDGVIEGIYSDELNELAEKMGGEVSQICRASNVEWEELDDPPRKGWTVRAAHDPEIAIRDNERIEVGKIGRVITFDSRERALETEREFFWDLIQGKEKK